MSFWKQLAVKPGKGSVSFLFSLNSHGESVVYLLDGGGEINDFAVGPVGDTLERAVREVYPFAELNLNESGEPWLLYWKCDRWRDVAALLNGNATVARAVCIRGCQEKQALRYAMLSGSILDRTITLTALAESYDREQDAKRAKEEADER